MIRRQTINKRKATVAYLRGDMSAADNEAEADLIKVIYDNGEVAWLTPKHEEEEPDDFDTEGK